MIKRISINIKINILGFDSGSGLPKTNKKEDLPFFWKQGDYTNQNIKDLYKEFNLDIPEIESSTIAGHVMDLAKKIPMYGETVKDNKFNYKITSHSRKQILRLEINKI